MKNPDGSPYKTLGSLQQFNPENKQICLLNFWDQEAIKLGGSPIFYHELVVNSGDIDPVYLEARNKLFRDPVQLWGFYVPTPTTNYVNQYGIDGIDMMIFEFNYRMVLDTLGHRPIIGSRLFTPHKGENWVIKTIQTNQYDLWNAIRLQMVCDRYQESITTQEGAVTQRKTDFNISPLP